MFDEGGLASCVAGPIAMFSRSTWRAVLGTLKRRTAFTVGGTDRRHAVSTLGELDVVLTDPSLVPDHWGSADRDRPDYAVTDYDVRSLDEPLEATVPRWPYRQAR